MHLDEERLQRLVHGELADSAAAAARAHVRSCAECAARVARVEAEEGRLNELLRALDGSPRRVQLRDVMTQSRPTTPPWLRIAAGIIIAVVAAGVAYAAPGSPLPSVVDEIVGWMSGQPDTPQDLAPAPLVDAGGLGVALPPGDRLTIEFEHLPTGAVAAVALTDGDVVEVVAVDGAARFNSDVERLVVSSDGATAFEIRVPRDAPTIVVLANGRERLRVVLGRVTPHLAVDGDGMHRVVLLPGDVPN